MEFSTSKKGALAESIFTIEAMRRNLSLSKPLIDNKGYDFVVHSRNRFIRVQIKSVTKPKRANSYRINACHGSGEMYTDKQCDYIAFYVFPINKWWIIPIDNINAKSIHINPHKIGKYTKYLNAWDLLT